MKQTGFEIYTTARLKWLAERALSVGDFAGARRFRQAIANKREYDAVLASQPDEKQSTSDLRQT